MSALINLADLDGHQAAHIATLLAKRNLRLEPHSEGFTVVDAMCGLVPLGAPRGVTAADVIEWVERRATDTGRPPAAAVVDGRLHDDELVRTATRIVPFRAKRIACGSAQLGYQHRTARGGRPNLAAIRLREFERLIGRRHGDGGVDTDDGEIYLDLVVHVLVPLELERAAGRADPTGIVCSAVRDWCARWLPRISAETVSLAVERAIAGPRCWRADTAAKVVMLTMAERTALDIRTIGAIDADVNERARLAKARHAERQREARARAREAGTVKSRAAYEGASVAQQCRQRNISRSTFYRQRKAAAEQATACDRSRAAQRREILDVAHGTCRTAETEAPPARPRRASLPPPDIGWQLQRSLIVAVQRSMASVSRIPIVFARLAERSPWRSDIDLGDPPPRE